MNGAQGCPSCVEVPTFHVATHARVHKQGDVEALCPLLADLSARAVEPGVQHLVVARKVLGGHIQVTARDNHKGPVLENLLAAIPAMDFAIGLCPAYDEVRTHDVPDLSVGEFLAVSVVEIPGTGELTAFQVREIDLHAVHGREGKFHHCSPMARIDVVGVFLVGTQAARDDDDEVVAMAEFLQGLYDPFVVHSRGIETPAEEVDASASRHRYSED